MIGFSLVLAIVFGNFVSGYEPPKNTTVPCDCDLDCVSVEHTVCMGNTGSISMSGLCSCTRKYVLRQQGNKFECLEEAKLFKDPCEIDDQCKPEFGESAACIGKKCMCSPGAHFINLKCWKSSKLGETCGDPFNCVATEHSQCDGRCSCVPGYIGNPASTKCLKIAEKLGDGCEDSIQCKSVNKEAICQYSVCLCPTGYIPQGKDCFKEAKLFDDPCQIPDQCAKFGQFSTCIQNKCKCSPGAHFTNSMCWKSNKLGETCANPNNCVAEHSQCNGVCSCLSGYVANSANTKCLKIPQKLNEPCENTAQCTALNQQATCQSNICSCPQGYISHETKCVAELNSFNDPCQIDEQCRNKFGEFSGCIKNNCKCSPWAHFANSKCWKSSHLGEPCDEQNNCVSGHSQCNNACRCVYGFIANQANTKCLKIANRFGDPCEESVQCEPINQKTSCQRNVCICEHGYIPKPNNVCEKGAVPPQHLLRKIPPAYKYLLPQEYQQHLFNSSTGLNAPVVVILTALIMMFIKW